ncbi:DUF882 domain-containing protein [Ferrimonas marina]|uniref:Murein endopeptidase K n=1 Tax=Ferrimonas marina TaxID=299255 RepID=A0A1M5YVT6_9GAMM|nr:DUF882 domain-containing protein [Ferrimonas marina]SHI15673.1 Uncharacterized conserved protein YcbK, DUF882 family [Ferrimonas marina]
MGDLCPQRRRLLRGSLAGALLASAPSLARASLAAPEVAPQQRELTLYNRHTGERQTALYFHDYQYDSEAVASLDAVLRDHRANEVAPMDRRLYDLVHRLTEALDYQGEVHVVSGYRSMKTNTMLAERNGGVAKRSFHTRAMAMDLVLPGVELDRVRLAARQLAMGGVGYYPRSGFVHVDTGPLRAW